MEYLPVFLRLMMPQAAPASVTKRPKPPSQTEHNLDTQSSKLLNWSRLFPCAQKPQKNNLSFCWQLRFINFAPLQYVSSLGSSFCSWCPSKTVPCPLYAVSWQWLRPPPATHHFSLWWHPSHVTWYVFLFKGILICIMSFGLIFFFCLFLIQRS